MESLRRWMDSEAKRSIVGCGEVHDIVLRSDGKSVLVVADPGLSDASKRDLCDRIRARLRDSAICDVAVYST